MARQGLPARIQFRALFRARCRTKGQTKTILVPTQNSGREIDRLRDNGSGRRVNFSARVPEGHGCIGCKLFTVLWEAGHL